MCIRDSLDRWLLRYNQERTHQGKYCFGRTPYQTFEQSKQLAQEKVIDQLLEEAGGQSDSQTTAIIAVWFVTTVRLSLVYYNSIVFSLAFVNNSCHFSFIMLISHRHYPPFTFSTKMKRTLCLISYCVHWYFPLWCNSRDIYGHGGLANKCGTRSYLHWWLVSFWKWCLVSWLSNISLIYQLLGLSLSPFYFQSPWFCSSNGGQEKQKRVN